MTAIELHTIRDLIVLKCKNLAKETDTPFDAHAVEKLKFELDGIIEQLGAKGSSNVQIAAALLENCKFDDRILPSQLQNLLLKEKHELENKQKEDQSAEQPDIPWDEAEDL